MNLSHGEHFFRSSCPHGTNSISHGSVSIFAESLRRGKARLEIWTYDVSTRERLEEICNIAPLDPEKREKIHGIPRYLAWTRSGVTFLGCRIPLHILGGKAIGAHVDIC